MQSMNVNDRRVCENQGNAAEERKSKSAVNYLKQIKCEQQVVSGANDVHMLIELYKYAHGCN